METLLEQFQENINTENGPHISEGAYAPNTQGRRRTSAGRPRRGKSTGRYPFLTAAKKWMDGRVLAESTRQRMWRNINQLNEMLEDLKIKGLISTTNPKKIVRNDVRYIEEELKKGRTGSTVEKLRGIIELICRFENNNIYEKMKNEGESFSKRTEEEVQTLTEAEVQEIIQKTAEIEGWYGVVSLLLATVYPYTGMRVSELRMANIDDIDFKKWTIRVRNPKGKGKYGKQRLAPILEPAQEGLIRYLKVREKHLIDLGIDPKIKPLIPSIHRGKIGYYPESKFRFFKKLIQEKMPEDFPRFSLKTFRATFCQIALEDAPERFEDVSISMGHGSITTTQKFYRRIDAGVAVSRVQESYVACRESKPKGAISSKIENKNWISGYV